LYQPIGSNDAAIADHTMMPKFILVTSNTRQFLRVPGLVVEDWV
jgi:tRNA(fMet)-specific endonuclease VapC